MWKTKLNQGDKVSLQSMSGGMAGDSRFLHKFQIGKKRIEKLGLAPTISINALKGIEFISKHPEKRAKDFMDAYTDKDIKMLVANIGGFDSHELIQFLDRDLIRQNPKPIIGYSDITSLHLYLYKLGIQTYYGPSVLDGFAENVQMHELTLKSVKDVLFTNNVQNILSSKTWTSEFLDWTNPSFDSIKRKMNNEKHGHIFLNFHNNVSGHLIGGNLDTIIHIKNQIFFPKLDYWKNAVIFLETSEQKMKPIDFQKSLDLIKDEISVANAVIFGKPKDEEFFEKYLEIVKNKIHKPVVFNLNIGHTAPMYTIPYGGVMNIDMFKKEIKIRK